MFFFSLFELIFRFIYKCESMQILMDSQISRFICICLDVLVQFHFILFYYELDCFLFSFISISYTDRDEMCCTCDLFISLHFFSFHPIDQVCLDRLLDYIYSNRYIRICMNQFAFLFFFYAITFFFQFRFILPYHSRLVVIFLLFNMK